MKDSLSDLQRDFMRMCRARGPQWVESVMRPLRLQNEGVNVHTIPPTALRAIVSVFGPLRRPPAGAE
jgi:hypothetical protein